MKVPVSSCQLATLATSSPKVQRAFIAQMTHRSLTAFFPVGWEILHPGAPPPTAPYIHAMLYRIEQLVTGDLKRLVNNLPPRHGKTEFGTVMLAAWILGRDPAAKIFIVSYGLALSENITRMIRKIMEHAAYKRIFPKTRLQVGQNRMGHFFTTAGGECMAASQDSAITGFGTHYMLIDDFQKADEALSAVERENAITTFRNTLLSRFDNLGDGRILINQQRLHEDDISGFAIGLGWPCFKLPAIATKDEVFALPSGKLWHRVKGDLLDPDRVPRSYLDEQKKAQGFRHFSAQYQQEPDVSDSGLVDWSWFGQYHDRPERDELLQVVQSWDPAMTERLTADYSVGMTWGYDGVDWYLLDLIRVQVGFPELIERVAATHRRWEADVLLIEGGSMGTALYQKVKGKRLPGVLRNITPRISKQDRLAACTAQLEGGGYLLPAEAPWLEAFQRELMAFPDGRNDDQVDALTQFLDYVFGRGGRYELRQDRFGNLRRSDRAPRRERRYRSHSSNMHSS